MICFIMTEGHRYTLENVRKESRGPAIRVLNYDQLIGSRRLKRATYVFTDLDRLAYSDLEIAGRIYVQLRDAGVRVLNNPAKVKLRYSLLRALNRAGINDFNVHPAEEIPQGMRFPVYLRKMRGHGEPCTGLLQERHEVEKALAEQIEAGVPAEHLMIIEYAGEPVRPGVYRKLSEFRMGSALTPYLCGHDSHWLVKTGQVGIAGDDLYEDEYRIVSDDPYANSLREAFALAEIEYGRADFGFYQGRPQIFEINTNPHIPAPGLHPSAKRVQTMDLAWKKILQTLHTIDSEPGPDILLPKDNLLKRYRKWSRFLYRTREAS